MLHTVHFSFKRKDPCQVPELLQMLEVVEKDMPGGRR